jgi:hypothetical protein
VPRSQEHGNMKGRIWPLVFAALAVFGAFGSLQMILAALNVHLVPTAPAVPTSSHGVVLVQASDNPAPVALPAIAQPVDVDQAPASMPNVSSSKETGLVADEDARVRSLVHASAHARQPEVVSHAGALATLVLPARAAAYTVTDLVQQNAMVMLSGHVALLQENVFVASGAKLSLGAPDLSTLYLASSSSGFTSIVAWGGSLSFAGTAAQPLTIMSWNQAAKSAVTDKGDGRPYIRAIGATMTFAYTRVSALGFWSGRTGGVAWTGTSRASSKGSAVNSTFTGNTYGAFVSRGQGVTFSADRFEFNELDGLNIHRHSIGSQVTSSSAVRNGGNGFLVDRATTNTLLRGDVSQHNAANGYLFDGRPLVTGASASGGSNVPGSGTVLENSSATGNGHTSVLIEGGTGTVVKSDQFCSPTTAIALRTGVTNAVITGNYINCAPRSGISVGPSAPGTVIYGNIVSRPSIGLLIRNSGAVSMYDNRIVDATVFGTSARGAASKVGGVDNVMSGTGDRAVDARTDASVSGLSGTDTSGWGHHARVTFISYLEFHPLASLWLGILVVILLAAGWSYRRKLPDHPYPASVRVAVDPYPARLESAAGRHTGPRPTGRLTGPQPTGRHTAPQPAGRLTGALPAGRYTGPQPTGRLTGPQPTGRLTGPQPTGRHTGPQPTGRHTAPQPTGRYTGPQPAGPYTGPQPAGRQAAPQPTAGRPAARPAMLPAAWNAPGMPQPAPPQPAPRPQPALPEPSRHWPAHREPAHPERPHHEPVYREPAPTGWDRPVRDPVHSHSQGPMPAPLPAAPSGPPAPWPEMPAHRGPGADRATRGQQALPSEANRPSGRRRPADPAGEEVHVTRPIQKGVWE